MADKENLSEALVQMGFSSDYIKRAFKVYEKNYGNNYDLDVLTEIVVRLKQKDEQRDVTTQPSAPSPSNKVKGPPPDADAASSHKLDQQHQQHPTHPPPQPAHKDPISMTANSQKQNPHHDQLSSKSEMDSVRPVKTSPLPPGPRPSGKQLPLNEKNTVSNNNTNTVTLANNNNNPNLNNDHNNISENRGVKNYNNPATAAPTAPTAPAKKRPNNESDHSEENNTNRHHQQTPSVNLNATLSIGDQVYYKTPTGAVIIAQVMELDIPNKRVQISYPLNKDFTERQLEYVSIRLVQKIQTKSEQNTKPEPKVSEKTVKPTLQQSSSDESQLVNEKTVKPQKAQPQSKKPVPPPTTIPEYVPHMTIEEAENLRLHDFIDHRDEVGRYLYATVVEKLGSTLKVHYDGWGRKWDCYSDYKKEIHRFAKAGSISKRSAHRFVHLKKGDFVDINPKMRHEGWVVGEIRRRDKKSGQVQVVYEKDDKNFLFWAHLDDKDSIAEFMSKSGAVQKNQMDVEKQIKSGEKKEPARPPAKPKKQHYYVNDPEAMLRLRAQRFPKQENEVIDNKYAIGDWLEVQDIRSTRWIPGNVIDKENNWIVVHYDGFSTKFDQRLHVLEMKSRLRPLGGGLEPDEIELEIKEEMDNFVKGLNEWKWELLTIEADGNCLYRSFAHEIYGDQKEHMKVRQECVKYMENNRAFFQNFILDWDETIQQKSRQYEWGDHVDINAMSELYNVRVQVYELNKATGKLYMSYDQGGTEEIIQDLPVVLLARHRKKHYNIIKNPDAYLKKPRPLGVASSRTEKASMREIRLKEEAQDSREEKDSKDDENDHEQNQDRDRLADSHSGRGLFNVQLQTTDFNAILEKNTKNRNVLTVTEVEKILPLCLDALYRKAVAKWKKDHTMIPVDVLEKSYIGRYAGDALTREIQSFIGQLTEKTKKDIFDSEVVLSTFNTSVVNKFNENVASLLQSQIHRQSISSPEKKKKKRRRRKKKKKKKKKNCLSSFL